MRKLLTIAIFMLAIFPSLWASHAAGGEIYYECTGPNTYDIHVRLFRDCNPGNVSLPSTVTVGIYNQSTHALLTSLSLTQGTVDANLDLGDNCYTPSGLCIDEAIYTATAVSIPDNADGYYLETHINTRNSLADNLSSPSSYTLLYFAELSDPALGQNSSPNFGNYPLDSYFCINSPKEWTFPVTDADGDSLVYSFVEPLGNTASSGTTAGSGAYPFYSTVPWATGYSLANIYNGFNPMTINSQTGEIYAFPSNLGTYAFVVRIEDYRNGVKMGEVRRDVQYAAMNCTLDQAPSVNFPSYFETPFDLEGSCIDFTLSDADGADTIFIYTSSADLDMEGTFVSPNTNNGVWYYDDFNGTSQSDSMVYFDELPNNTYVGIGKLSLRYCYLPDCNDLERVFDINVSGYSYGCSGYSDTSHVISQMVLVPQSSEMYPNQPNVFTPNGDGDNDVYKLFGSPDPCYDEMDIKIYNRWGQLVFESEDPYFEWDGTKHNKGKECPTGVYFVIMQGGYGSVYDADRNRTAMPVDYKFAIELMR